MSGSGAVHGVLVTFRRRGSLRVVLQRLAEQTRRLDTLVVVDNEADPQVKGVVGSIPDAARRVEYVPASDNLGPAGGLALGSRTVLQAADDADWTVFLDDDDPPRTDDILLEITGFGVAMLRTDPNTAGVGLVGARFDTRTGQAVRVADHELHGPVSVDYIGGGQFPCYRVASMRAVGLPESRLFFGYDDLEYGLRLRTAGWRLYVDGATWTRERRVWGWAGVDRVPSRKLQAVGWRDYYRTRNMTWILRRNGYHLTAARFVARRFAKVAYNVPRSPATGLAHLSLGIRAAYHAYTGEMGRTVDPPGRADHSRSWGR